MKVNKTNTKERLLDAAAEVVAQQGALALTLDAVAAQAGVSKGGLLYHFPTKEALLKAMVDRMLARLREAMAEQQSPEASQADRFAVFIRTAFDQSARPGGSGSLLAAATLQPDLLEPVKVMAATAREWAREATPDDRGEIAYFATYGIWFGEIFGLFNMDEEERRCLADRLAVFIGSK